MITIERIIFIIVIILGFWFMNNNRNKISDKLAMQTKLTEALFDSMSTYKDKEGQWVSEKRTIQGDINELLNGNIKLSEEKKSLLEDIKKFEKNSNKQKEVFAAAQLKYKSFIDSINSVESVASSIDTINNTVSFVNMNDTSQFIYDVDILGIRPLAVANSPRIKFNYIGLPNTQTITFSFDKNKRKDYPVSFTVVNSNDYFKPSNIESYAIPSIQKNALNPNKWQKIKMWFGQNGKYVIFTGVGTIAGILLPI